MTQRPNISGVVDQEIEDFVENERQKRGINKSATLNILLKELYEIRKGTPNIKIDKDVQEYLESRIIKWNTSKSDIINVILRRFINQDKIFDKIKVLLKGEHREMTCEEIENIIDSRVNEEIKPKEDELKDRINEVKKIHTEAARLINIFEESRSRPANFCSFCGEHLPHKDKEHINKKSEENKTNPEGKK